MRRIRKLLKLTPSEYCLLAESVLMLGVVKIGLWLLPFRTMHRLVAARKLKAGAVDKELERRSIKRVVWAVDVVSHYIPLFKNCLNRALATQVLLKRRGHRASLQIGVQRGEEGQFEAHAWIESEGKIVLGRLPSLSTYTRLPSLESKGL
jgi:hypothetical protein